MMRSRKNQKKILSKQCIQSSYTFTPHLEVMRGKKDPSDSLSKQCLFSYTPQHRMARSVGSPNKELNPHQKLKVKTMKRKSINELEKIANKNTNCEYKNASEYYIKAKIHSIWSENEEQKPIYNGWLKDRTGEIRFSIWSEKELELKTGDLVKISSFILGKYRNDPTLIVQDTTCVEIPVDREPKDRKPRERKPEMNQISEIHEPLNNVHLIAKVVKVTENNSGGYKKKIAMIKDRTGKIDLKIWFDCKIKKGDVIHLKGGFVDFYQNKFEIELNEEDFLEKLPPTVA